MKNQKRLAIAFILFLISAFPSKSIFAQEWSDAQKGVWKNVETYWNLFAQGNVEGLMAYYHESYKGWDNDSPLPQGKATSEKGQKHFLQGNKIILHQIDPVSIEIHGNFAFVHYYYSMLFKNPKGEEQNGRGRWTDILTKQGDKWVLIGDHGGSSSGN